MSQPDRDKKKWSMVLEGNGERVNKKVYERKLEREGSGKIKEWI